MVSILLAYLKKKKKKKILYYMVDTIQRMAKCPVPTKVSKRMFLEIYKFAYLS